MGTDSTLHGSKYQLSIENQYFTILHRQSLFHFESCRTMRVSHSASGCENLEKYLKFLSFQPKPEVQVLELFCLTHKGAIQVENNKQVQQYDHAFLRIL